MFDLGRFLLLCIICVHKQGGLLLRIYIDLVCKNFFISIFHIIYMPPCNWCVQCPEYKLINLSIDDAPRYKRGNRVLVALVVMNFFIYCLTKAYYVFRNTQRDRKWNSFSEEQKVEYLANPGVEGNKRLDFRFAH